MTGPIDIIHGHLRAKRSIDVITDANAPRASSMLLTVAKEQRTHFNPNIKIRQIAYGSLLEKNDWETRVLPGSPSVPLLLGDADIAVTLHEEMRTDGWLRPKGAERIDQFIIHFDRLWSLTQGLSNKNLLLYEDLVESSEEVAERAIVSISEDQWSAVIRMVASDPLVVRRFSPREFERFVLELLFQEGYDARLTPERRDGGYDIVARKHSSLGNHLYLVECKRYADDNPVGVSLVRALYGTIIAMEATAGLLVTTSRFTRGALEFREPVQHRLGLADFEDLKKWVNKIGDEKETK